MKQTCSHIGFRKIHFAGQRKTRKQSKKHKIPAIWAYVTDTVSLAADHCNKVKISMTCHMDFSVSSDPYIIIHIYYINHHNQTLHILTPDSLQLLIRHLISVFSPMRTDRLILGWPQRVCPRSKN